MKPFRLLRLNAKLIAIFSAAVLLVFYFWILFAEQEKVAGTRKSPEVFITYNGFPSGMDIEANYIAGKDVAPLLPDNGKIRLPARLAKNLTLPYKAQAVFKTAQNDYYEFTWTVDDRGIFYDIAITGFDPDDTVGLIMNDDQVFTKPFDWSGRIELQNVVLDDRDLKTCLKITHQDHNYSVCHFLTAKQAA